MKRALALVALVLLTACGGRTWSQHARIGVNSLGHGLAAFDALAAERYVAETANQQGEAFERVDARFRAIQQAEETARDSLLALEVSLNAWDRSQRPGDRCPVLSRSADAVEVMSRLVTVARTAGLSVPAEVTQARDALNQATALLRPFCTADAADGADGGDGGR